MVAWGRLTTDRMHTISVRLHNYECRPILQDLYATFVLLFRGYNASYSYHWLSNLNIMLAPKTFPIWMAKNYSPERDIKVVCTRQPDENVTKIKEISSLERPFTRIIIPYKHLFKRNTACIRKNVPTAP